MTDFFKWLQLAPPNAIPLISALVAAAVAISVAVLTQWILERRGRTDFLTRKLEEVYLLIVQLQEEMNASKAAAEELAKVNPASRDVRRKFAETYLSLMTYSANFNVRGSILLATRGLRIIRVSARFCEVETSIE